ncbi:MAG: cation:proton antiporter, partial [Stellaceae bacterium]
APTDAALGKPVVTNPAVPGVMREALNIESGLNDGICVPIVVLLLGLAIGTQLEHGTMVHAIRVVAEELGIGLVVGVVLTWLTILMLRFAGAKGWISEHWEEIPIVALAAASFAAAQAIGGSGFIACFVGGLLLSGLRPARKEQLLRGAAGTGEALALLTWVAFGGGALTQIIPRLGWVALTYAVLSLTVIRMVPVVLCLAGTGNAACGQIVRRLVRPAGPGHNRVWGHRPQREAPGERHDHRRRRRHCFVERHRARHQRQPAG